MDLILEKAVEDVKRIDTNRNYWFIRSFGGELFKNFYEGGYVGLGLNSVPYEYIVNAHNENQNTYDNLVRYIGENTSYEGKEATKWANQLIRFEHDVKVGDVVVTPSKNSAKFGFGIIKSDTYLVQNPGTFELKDGYEPFPEKRKKVDWLKIMTKEVVRGELNGLKSSHQAIRPANDFQDVIEGNLSSLYIREERIYLTLRVNRDEDINAFDLKRLLDSLTYFYQEFCEESGIEKNEDLTIKIKLQSRGKMALSGLGLAAVVGIAGIVAVSNNNEFTMRYDAETNSSELSAKSDGLLQSISDFLDRKQERKIKYEIFKDSLTNLRVQRMPEGAEDEGLDIDTITVEDSGRTDTLKVFHSDSDQDADTGSQELLGN